MLHGRRGRVPLFGPLSGLVPLHGSSSVNVTRPARVTKTVALSGRVSAQRGPAPRREWGVDVESAYPEHVALLQGVEAGAFGSGPFFWFDELAQVTNMLTPTESTLGGATWTGGVLGGAGTTADGTRFLFSRNADAGIAVTLTDRLAVPPEYPVTASVYVSTHPTASATLQVREWNVEGAIIATHSDIVPADSYAHRAAVTFTTSPFTASLSFDVISPLMVTMPAVTLTDRPLPWGTGQGCRQAIVETSGYSVRKAVAHPNGRRIGYGITIHELG